VSIINFNDISKDFTLLIIRVKQRTN